MKRAVPLFAVAALLGCGGTTSFTRTGPTVAAQPGGCDFAVVKVRPSEPHTELGTIDIKYTSQMDWIYDEAAFKRKVRPLVCQSGGDVAVAHTNDNGLYVRATVLSSKAPPPAAPAEAPPTPETAAQASETAPAKAPASSAPPSAVAAPVETKKETKKEPTAKTEDSAPEAPARKKGGKKGATAKKDADTRGKDGKVDIDKLL